MIYQLFDEVRNFLILHPYVKTILLNLILLVIFIVIKRLIHRNIDKREDTKQEKTRLKRSASRHTTYAFFTCVFFIWFTQLQVFFVSILAVAAAVVLALKELIMCLTGGILINISNIFKVGHRIEINDTRGFVIEKNLLTTKILEIGPEKNSQQTTGDIITIPNSVMLSKSLKNESYFKGYSIKSFVFKIEDEKKVLDFEQVILKTAINYCHVYISDAKNHISKFCDKEGLVVPSIEPKTKIIVEDGKIFLVLVKLPVKNSEIARIEQELNRAYLNWRVLQKANQNYSES